MAERVILINKGRMVFDGPRNKLEHLFGDKRMIDLEFSSTARIRFSGYGKVIEHTDNFVKLEVNKRVLKSASFMSMLSSDNVIDYKVYEPGLNFVLSKLYRKIDRKR